MYCLESKISKQVLLTRKLYCVPSNDDAELIRKLNAVNTLDLSSERVLNRTEGLLCGLGTTDRNWPAAVVQPLNFSG